MVNVARDELTDRFRDLYDRTYERAWAFVLRRAATDDEARDVVGDTYLAVWRRMRDVPTDVPQADAWVFGTARKVLSNHRRARSRRERLHHRLESIRPVDGTDNADGNEQLLRALDQLPAKHRDVLEMALWDEFTVPEIAQILGCSENAVSIRTYRARAALRERYDALSGRKDSL
jgi:RNA polymerase sigma-70 factor (ECF subfamily)